MPFVWTDDFVLELKRLNELGLSASQIAKEMNCGITKSAVIGKLFRLGVPSVRGLVARKSAECHAEGRKARKEARIARFERSKLELQIADSTKNSRIRGALIARAVALGELPENEKVRITPEVIPYRPVALLALRDADCRWPICDDDDNTIGFAAGHAEMSWCRIANATADARFIVGSRCH